MSRRLVIVGAGGFGREVYAWVNTSPHWKGLHDVSEIVAIDDATPEVSFPVAIVSTVSLFRPEPTDVAICAIGSPTVRERVVRELETRGLTFPAFLHDSVVVGERVAIGEGAVVCPMTVLSCDIVVGSHVHLNCGVTVGHDVSVGDFATLSSACNLTGGVTVGRGAFLGTAVTVVPGVTIGEESYSGAGSVILRNVSSGSRVFGNPSVRIGGKS